MHEVEDGIGLPKD